MKVLLMQYFQTVPSVLTHRAPHSAKPPSRILPQRGENMNITVLMENTEGARGCSFAHGLSVYLETGRHKVLVDAGPSEETLGNAAQLGIDLSQADTAVLSHGHYDHSGGLMAFAQAAPGARIYMHEKAGGDYYSVASGTEKYIGIDKALCSLPQVRTIREDTVIDDELSIFTGVSGKRMLPRGNRSLKVREGGVLVQDDFSHEIYLVVTCGGKKILVGGCAHNGILNILDRFRELHGKDPDLVITGFHMMKKVALDEEDLAIVQATAKELAGKDTVFYSGHCTGEEAYAVMKEYMGEKLHHMHSGDSIPFMQKDEPV